MTASPLKNWQSFSKAKITDLIHHQRMILIVEAMLAMTGRVTMLGLSRWTEKGGSYRTVQRFFKDPKQFIFFKLAVGEGVKPSHTIFLFSERSVNMLYSQIEPF